MNIFKYLFSKSYRTNWILKQYEIRKRNYENGQSLTDKQYDTLVNLEMQVEKINSVECFKKDNVIFIGKLNGKTINVMETISR